MCRPGHDLAPLAQIALARLLGEMADVLAGDDGGPVLIGPVDFGPASDPIHAPAGEVE